MRCTPDAPGPAGGDARRTDPEAPDRGTPDRNIPDRDIPDRGSTLVGVMAAGVVLGTLALGLANLWPVLNRLSFDALLRQKAVFVLNGEMERLAALFATTGFGGGKREKSEGYAALPNLANSDRRRVYAPDSTGVTFAVGTLAAFQAAETNVWVVGSGKSARNYVWLDRERGLVAQISWLECNIDPNRNAGCWSVAAGGDVDDEDNSDSGDEKCFSFKGGGKGSWCRHVVLVLEYPYRITGSAAVPLSPRTMTLGTIVGRRL